MAKLWTVVGGERYDDYTGTIGVCATLELAEELQARTNAHPRWWATIHEEELITELPEWTPPREIVTWTAYWYPEVREIRVYSETGFGTDREYPGCDPDHGCGEAFGTDKDAVIGFVRKWCEDRSFRNIPVVES